MDGYQMHDDWPQAEPTNPLEITYYAIRNMYSGGYLFIASGKKSTSTPPVTLKAGGHPPRLFPSKIAATNALGAWLKGIFYNSEDGMVVQKTPDRNRDHMEIVPVKVVLPPL